MTRRNGHKKKQTRAHMKELLLNAMILMKDIKEIAQDTAAYRSHLN